MPSKIFSAALVGLDCTIVEVETDYRRTNTYFSIVGMADKSVQEAKDRIPSAIRNSGFEFVPVRIVVNLAPADLIKSGPSYDLPIALGYLAASNQLDFDTKEKLFVGELALDGRLRPVSGILPIVHSAKRKGIKEVFIPKENEKEATLISGINIVAADDLRTVVNHLTGFNPTPYSHPAKWNDYVNLSKNNFDLKQVNGQTHAKRALEIAAAGSHNLLLNGVPGSGKTLLSRCIPGILPKLTYEESIEVTKIYSIAGLTSKNKPLITTRPFRSPHHTASTVSLVGGGGKIRPGEISLAHRGVLFLDEFPEFSAQTLESLRQPIEDKVVNISRASGSISFPANFMLVAAMNPCKCGYHGDPVKTCTCTEFDIAKYRKRISGPIIDRIDLIVPVAKVENAELFKDNESESSEKVRQRVEAAKDIQIQKFKGTVYKSNSDLDHEGIKKFIKITTNAKLTLQKAAENWNLSARSYFRILKVAQTIADLNNIIVVEEETIMEALSFRVEST